MDYIAVLERDLERGFSKADLERLIGLPKNNLSGILKKNRILSRKSELKIEKWEASQKPNPFEINFENKLENLLVDNRGDIRKIIQDSTELGVSMYETKLNEKGKVDIRHVDPLSDEGKKVLSDYDKRMAEERVIVLRNEIAKPPSNPMIGLRKYLSVREQELKELLSKLK